MTFICGNGKIELRLGFADLDMQLLLSGDGEEDLFKYLISRSQKNGNAMHRYSASRENIDALIGYLVEHRERLVHGALKKRELPLPTGDIRHYLEKIETSNGHVSSLLMRYNFKRPLSDELIEQHLDGFNEISHKVVESVVTQLKAIEGKRDYNFEPYEGDYKVLSMEGRDDGFRLNLSRDYYLETKQAAVGAKLLASLVTKPQLAEVQVTDSTLRFTIQDHIHIKA
ncbi:MAG: hypothetical protein RSD49_06805 [Hafnia sp.]